MSDQFGMFGKPYGVLKSVLNRRSQRHRLLSSNVANIETPHYQGQDLAFKTRLRAYIETGQKPVELARTNVKHFPTGKPGFGPMSQVVDTGPVKLDIEMAKLAENNLMYNALVQVLSKKYSLVRHAIIEGSK